MKRKYKAIINYESLEKSPAYIAIKPEMTHYVSPTSKYPVKNSNIKSFID